MTGQHYSLVQAFMIYALVDSQMEPLFDKDLNPPAHYIESHEIYYDPKGKPSLLPGKPLSLDAIKRLVSSLSDQANLNFRSGLIPVNILAMDSKNSKFLWYSPPSTRRLIFHKSLEIPSGDYACPGLLFYVSNNNLNLFALKIKEAARPTQTTRLFLPPFHNTNSFGAVCTGNVTLPDSPSSLNQLMQAWENVFFNSQFTHPNDDLKNFWISMAAKTEFPLGSLSPCTEYKTLGNLMEGENL